VLDAVARRKAVAGHCDPAPNLRRIPEM